jgi:hypothetical protein
MCPYIVVLISQVPKPRAEQTRSVLPLLSFPLNTNKAVNGGGALLDNWRLALTPEFAAMQKRGTTGASTGAPFSEGGYDMYLVQTDFGATVFAPGIYTYFRQIKECQEATITTTISAAGSTC